MELLSFNNRLASLLGGHCTTTLLMIPYPWWELCLWASNFPALGGTGCGALLDGDDGCAYRLIGYEAGNYAGWYAAWSSHWAYYTISTTNVRSGEQVSLVGEDNASVKTAHSINEHVGLIAGDRLHDQINIARLPLPTLALP